MNKNDPIANRLTEGGIATVLGFGVSNRPLVRKLLSMGSSVTVRDAKSAEELGEEYAELSSLGVKFILGDNYLENICEDVIFRSPGIRPDAGSIPAAISRGAMLTSEMEWFLSTTPAKIIAITGSDGKTTTTTLTYKLLEEEYKDTDRNVYVGGNIGTPLLPLVEQMTEKDFAVVELSSFQLQTMNVPISRAVITNITPNHLNWHTDMEEYSAAKANVFANESTELLVVNARDDRTRAYGMTFPRDTAYFSDYYIPDECSSDGKLIAYDKDGAICVKVGDAEICVVAVDDILLPGRHNIENYMAAISVTWGLVSRESVEAVAKTFRGVEHRLEFVREKDGVKYYNSSIDSSPTRTAAALSALKEKPIVICGGYDKNIPFEPLAQALAERAKAVVLTGATAGKIMQAINGCTAFDKESIPTVTVPDFEEAVKRARDMAKAGDTVLLSPACASFDAFPNFAARGNTFKKIVENF